MTHPPLAIHDLASFCWDRPALGVLWRVHSRVMSMSSSVLEVVWVSVLVRCWGLRCCSIKHGYWLLWYIKLSDQYGRGVYSSRVLGSGWGHCRDCNEEATGDSAKPRARKHSPGGNLTQLGSPIICVCVSLCVNLIFYTSS